MSDGQQKAALVSPCLRIHPGMLLGRWVPHRSPADTWDLGCNAEGLHCVNANAWTSQWPGRSVLSTAQASAPRHVPWLRPSTGLVAMAPLHELSSLLGTKKPFAEKFKFSLSNKRQEQKELKYQRILF